MIPTERWQSKGVLHNEEFLITLILDGEGRSDTVPNWWREPVGNSRKRRAVAFAIAADVVQPVQPQRRRIDLTDVGRCFV